MIELATKGPEISGLKNESENYRNTIRKKGNGWLITLHINSLAVYMLLKFHTWFFTGSSTEHLKHRGAQLSVWSEADTHLYIWRCRERERGKGREGLRWLKELRGKGGVRRETFNHVPLHTSFSCKVQCSFHFLLWLARLWWFLFYFSCWYIMISFVRKFWGPLPLSLSSLSYFLFLSHAFSATHCMHVSDEF